MQSHQQPATGSQRTTCKGAALNPPPPPQSLMAKAVARPQPGLAVCLHGPKFAPSFFYYPLSCTHSLTHYTLIGALQAAASQTHIQAAAIWMETQMPLRATSTSTTTMVCCGSQGSTCGGTSMTYCCSKLTKRHYARRWVCGWWSGRVDGAIGGGSSIPVP